MNRTVELDKVPPGMAAGRKPDLSPTEHLLRMADVMEPARFDALCDLAETMFPALVTHLDTWGNTCGAPRRVYRGHVVRMFIDMLRQQPPENLIAQ